MSNFEVKKIVNYDAGYPVLKKENKGITFKAKILFILSFILILGGTACDNNDKEDQKLTGVPEFDADYAENPDADQELGGVTDFDVKYDDDKTPIPDIDYGNTEPDLDYDLTGSDQGDVFYDDDPQPDLEPDTDQELGGVTDFDINYDEDTAIINPDEDQELGGMPVPDCEYNGNIYQVGDVFPANDECNTCKCEENGQVACTLMECSPSK